MAQFVNLHSGRTHLHLHLKSATQMTVDIMWFQLPFEVILSRAAKKCSAAHVCRRITYLDENVLLLYTSHTEENYM